jgi:BON domain
MWTRLLAVFTIFPFALLLALVSALPGPASALDESSTTRLTIPMPAIHLEWAKGVAVLSGVVPDTHERQVIVRRAVAIYGRAQVVDRLQVGPVANPRWLSPEFVPDLRGLVEGVASLEDARIVVTGTAATPEAVRQIEAWLNLTGRAGLVVVNRVALHRTSAR